uniref:Uncharacterized protein n=1 Tax=Tetraselmis sp. GSL018 TaxID=582737 RepID=A0A061SN84_9CHLO|eukprot:CAMPEP_0177580596 /NCGR_PEP_ID=MMETSP0419_2-20121207/1651_1 /TAXON_ID=582737 /ORGANISM="Tetraselmis sp., Strain GSL018" /LENGTH=95 /DNA_ID=CAMNT_0019069487 /DNA_START=714 /DNA_END=1001 /DNA_ORIENTATION=-
MNQTPLPHRRTFTDQVLKTKMSQVEEDAETRRRLELDAISRVREMHRKCGDRNLAGFLQEFGFEVEGSWGPTKDEFDRLRKRGLVLCHPDKHLGS